MRRLLLLLVLAASPLAAQERPLAIQGAVDSELGPLLDAIGRPEPRVLEGFSFWEGFIEGRAVVVSRTEVGMVNAAVATTLLIREFSPSAIVNQGTAGAIDPDLRVGDIVIARATAPIGAFKTAPRKRGEGLRLEDWEILPRYLRVGGERVAFEKFDSDAELFAIATRVPYDGGRLVPGIVGSADQWNREIDKLLWASRVLGVASEDMESAAAHQVAQIFKVPFLAARIVSNSEYSAPEFRRELGTTCAAYAVDLVKAIAAADR
jgi:adenosylhomocysteine nucleosidase